jgi:hypothetical protein
VICSRAPQPVEGRLADWLSSFRPARGRPACGAVTLLRRLDSYDRAAYRSVAQPSTLTRKGVASCTVITGPNIASGSPG